MKKHKVSTFERDVVGWWERRKGQSVDDSLIGQFATYFWPRKQKFELEVMRTMVKK